MTLFSLINTALVCNLKKAGITEHSTHYLLHSEINETSAVIDLGANKGSFYSLMNEKYSCHCHAIEASESLFRNLPKKSKVKSYHLAIGGGNGLVKFYISKNPEANSLQPKIADTWGITKSVVIEKKTLEKFLTDENISMPIDVLKIDVEGAELEIIDNLSYNMLAKIAQIPIEFHDFIVHTIEYKEYMYKVISRLETQHFFIIKISAQDWRETLCINRTLIHLSIMQRARLTIIHPFLRKLKLLHINVSNLLISAGKNIK